MAGTDRWVERQILKAQAEGKLTGLPGEGKPLAEQREAPFVSAGEALGFRMMAEAGVLPEEIRWRKAANALRGQLAGEADPARRRDLMGELAQVEMRGAMAEEARRAFLR